MVFCFQRNMIVNIEACLRNSIKANFMMICLKCSFSNVTSSFLFIISLCFHLHEEMENVISHINHWWLALFFVYYTTHRCIDLITLSFESGHSSFITSFRQFMFHTSSSKSVYLCSTIVVWYELKNIHSHSILSRTKTV